MSHTVPCFNPLYRGKFQRLPVVRGFSYIYGCVLAIALLLLEGVMVIV